MKKIIRLSSVTYAIRAQKVLEQNGIRSKVKKLTQDMKVNGCGYGLEVAGDVRAAANLLTKTGIRVVEIIEIA